MVDSRLHKKVQKHLAKIEQTKVRDCEQALPNLSNSDAKRYKSYINPKHIREFHRVIEQEKVIGGFFIHTGKTGEMSKELLREYRITLLSGQ